MRTYSHYEKYSYYFRNARPFPELMDEMEKYAKERYIPICHAETGEFLSFMISMAKPAKILELGTAIGYSGLWMLSDGSYSKSLLTIEINKEYASIAQKNFLAAGLGKCVRIINDDISEVLPLLNERYDFIYIDAAKGQYYAWIDDCLRLLSPDGVIVMDNLFFADRIFKKGNIPHKHRTIVKNMRSLIKKLNRELTINTTIVPIGDGIAVCRKRSM